MKNNVRKVYMGTVWPTEEMTVEELVFSKMDSVLSEGTWTGTMSKLMAALNKVSSRDQRSLLPGSPSALRLVLNRVVNRLRNRGISVRFGRTTDRTRTRYVKFTR